MGNTNKGRTNDNTIDVNGTNEDGTDQPTTGDVQNFVTRLSEMITKELSGVYFTNDNDASGQISKITLDEYEGNGPKISGTNVSNIDGYTKNTHFHTHPTNVGIDITNVRRPSSTGRSRGDEGFKDRNRNVYERFLILIRYHGNVEEINY